MSIKKIITKSDFRWVILLGVIIFAVLASIAENFMPYSFRVGREAGYLVLLSFFLIYYLVRFILWAVRRLKNK